MALKRTSNPLMISGAVTESGANTFTQDSIDLQLNPLDNEVFVVTAVDLDMSVSPDAVAGANSALQVSLSNTSRTTVGGLPDSNVFATYTETIRSNAAIAVSFQKMAPETPTAANLDYIGILATDNFFAQIKGTGNATAKKGNFRVYGYRAKADSATYAALVQSELLSQ